MSGSRWATLLVLLLSGCGGDGETKAKKAPAPAKSAVATVPEEPARTAEECIDHWNAMVQIGSAGQMNPVDSVEEVTEDGPARAAMQFVEPDCVLLVEDPAEPRRALYFVGPDGGASFTLPKRVDLDRQVGKDREPAYNAEATHDGLLKPTG